MSSKLVLKFSRMLPESRGRNIDSPETYNIGEYRRDGISTYIERSMFVVQLSGKSPLLRSTPKLIPRDILTFPNGQARLRQH